MAALPEEIEVVEESPLAIRYLFPTRELGRRRWIAWGMVAIGATFGYWMMLQPVVAVVRNGPGIGNLMPPFLQPAPNQTEVTGEEIAVRTDLEQKIGATRLAQEEQQHSHGGSRPGARDHVLR